MSVAPSEYVQSLSRSEKGSLLRTLLRDFRSSAPAEPSFPLTDADGKPLGYFIPLPDDDPEWAQALAEMPAAFRADLFKPVPADFDPNDCLTDKERERIRQAAFARWKG